MTPKTIIPLLLLLATSIHAQHTATVISTNGLKLRARPDRHAKVLATAPFGARVEVLTLRIIDNNKVRYDPPARRDTTGELFPAEALRPAPLHIGYWLEVRYEGKKGYMFSGFLADKELLETTVQAEELNNRYRLRTTNGNACAGNTLVTDKGWNWYGLFRDGNGQYRTKKVEPEYAIADYTEENGELPVIDRELVYKVSGTQRPLYLFGTRDTWPERGGIQGFYQPDEETPQSDGTGIPDSSFFAQYGLSVRNSGAGSYSFLWSFVDAKGKLFPVEFPENDRKSGNYPVWLEWYGDLDGDGKPDYILNNSGEIGYLALYLSGQAGKGKPAGLVAFLLHWYCC